MAVKTVEKVTRSTPVTIGILDATIERFADKLTERLDRSIAEMTRSLAETNAKIAATDVELKALLADSEKRLKYLSGDCGAHGQGLGELVEFIVIPGIRPAMNSLGHHFKYASANKKIKVVIKGEKVRVAEVDLLLHNGAEAMAVEIKTCLTPEDVQKHVERLAKLRKHEAEAGIQGKALYGAVVGIIIEDHARRFALKHGLYVMEIMEKENTLKTDEPKKCRVW